MTDHPDVAEARRLVDNTIITKESGVDWITGGAVAASYQLILLARLLGVIGEREKLIDQLNARLTCMCGDYVEQHAQGSGHAPVAMYDYALDRTQAALDDKAREAAGLREALERAEHTLTVHGKIDGGTDLHSFIRASLYPETQRAIPPGRISESRYSTCEYTKSRIAAPEPPKDGVPERCEFCRGEGSYAYGPACPVCGGTGIEPNSTFTTSPSKSRIIE